MIQIYEPQNIEAKWQKIWTETGAFRTPTANEWHDRPKYYVLDMFPYPSGEGLHVGHPKGYTATDIIARMRRMQGYNVLHPMGWDAFGLPAERAADRYNMHPAAITKRNIDTFRRSLQRMGFSYDWAREINTSSPDYYEWTQWIFKKLFEKGLAYMADVPVNWCPALGTVLSNEEVQDGKYVETGDPVERRLMRQWMLKITAYADRLLSDLDELDWPESLKEMQRNWIGKSVGATIRFHIQNSDASFEVFTTRPDTLFGATYCVLAPEHPLVKQITTPAQQAAVEEYVQQSINRSDLDRTAQQEKTGVFTGAYAVNPATEQAIPIWVADYVLISYGEGAIMGVPGHDERDHEFAQQFGLPIINVVDGGQSAVAEAAYTDEGVAVNSAFLDGLHTAEAKERMTQWLEETGKGRQQIQYRLRDWLFSRQRYWGEPFPIVHLEDGSTVAVPDAELPVLLPDIDDRTPQSFDKPPLSRADAEWLMITLPDGRVGLRETNTMPQWAGSCWYYLRFVDPHNTQAPWGAAEEAYWMPVDLYVGGAEHAVLHLLYARFWHKVLYDCELVTTKEPFQQLFNQGMIGAYSYRNRAGKYFHRDDVVEQDDTWLVRATGELVATQLEKMSKSKLNVYNLDDIIAEYGADSLRLYELFIGPISASTPWNMDGIDGVQRFLHKIWRLIIDADTGAVNSQINAALSIQGTELERPLHKTIKGVTESIESIDKMNTAVSRMMEFINTASQYAADANAQIPSGIIKAFVRLLAPFAPHLAEELWERLGEQQLVSLAAWPQYDEELVQDEMIQVPIQINGRLRDVMTVTAGADDKTLENLALNNQKVVRHLNGAAVKRVIVVPGKLVNIIH
ncbi:MAG: leucine--tRNA ligase [Caldilineaceae bacterium]|nr:leucine--tRNA ligase [Caldilineaceae bacterium]MCB0138413.1 leucine--tRNA ligase [Caldilineaceae bacterium]